MKLELVSFGLPPTFPPELMPEAGARFVAECRTGMPPLRILTAPLNEPL